MSERESIKGKVSGPEMCQASFKGRKSTKRQSKQNKEINNKKRRTDQEMPLGVAEDLTVILTLMGNHSKTLSNKLTTTALLSQGSFQLQYVEQTAVGQN